MKLHVVDVCAFYSPWGGGVKTYVERKLQLARPGQLEITLVVPGDADRTIAHPSGGRIVMLRSPCLPVDRRYRYFDDERALHAALDRLAPDVVEVGSPWGSPRMVARWRGSALRSLFMHADPVAAYAYRWLGPLLARSAIDSLCYPFWQHLRRLDEAFDVVVSASPGLSARLVEQGLRKVTTVPMGVEPNVFGPRRRDPSLRAQMLACCGLPPSATLLVGAGRLSEEKRWPMVIEAAARAGRDVPVGLMLFGDGRARAAVARAAARHPNVRLEQPVGERAAFAAILASADAYVHGCEAETFCLVAAEARASGLPLIVPDAGGAFDQLQPGQGRAYRATSRIDLAAAIRDVANTLPADRARALVAAATVPDSDQHFRQLFSVYRAALARRMVAGAHPAVAARTAPSGLQLLSGVR